MAIWLCFIAKYTLAIWRHPIAKCMLAIWWQPIAKHSLAILATSYCLNRNDRVSSFYQTRGSKLCFLTYFSYFSRYFHILVFLWICYLLVSLRPFLASRESNSLSRFSYLWHYEAVRCTCAPIFLAQNAWVSQSKTLSAFHQRFLVQMSIGRTQTIPFLLTKILELRLSCVT
jgi:hypothetical protein